MSIRRIKIRIHFLPVAQKAPNISNATMDMSLTLPPSLTQPVDGSVVQCAQEQTPFVYDIDSSQESQGATQARDATQEDIEDSETLQQFLPSTLSFACSTPAPVIRRPLIVRPILKRESTFKEPPVKRTAKTMRSAKERPIKTTRSRFESSTFARDCFAGNLASIKSDPLSPAFVDLLRGVCSMFTATHGRSVDFSKVCNSFQ